MNQTELRVMIQMTQCDEIDAFASVNSGFKYLAGSSNYIVREMELGLGSIEYKFILHYDLCLYILHECSGLPSIIIERITLS